MLRIGPLELSSRLLVGTGKYPSFEVMRACHEASGTELVTIAIRRVDLDQTDAPGVLDYIDHGRVHLLPNTAGCYTPEDAITTAWLAREAFGTNLLKLEVIGDERTLYPDGEGTLEAARELCREGFVVLPYCTDDPVLCRRLEEVGCAAVMPLAAPIGTGLGVCNPYTLRLIVAQAGVPVIVDAGIGTASDAALALELGADAVLLNTAISAAKEPVLMAAAMKHAVIAGRLAFEAGRMPRRLVAHASSPEEGLFFHHD